MEEFWKTFRKEIYIKYILDNNVMLQLSVQQLVFFFVTFLALEHCSY